MKRILPIILITFLTSCGVDNPKIEEKETVIDTVAVNSIVANSTNTPTNGQFSDPGEDKMTESYLSLFFDIKGTHSIYNSNQIDELVKQREKTLVYDDQAFYYDLNYLSKKEMSELPIESFLYYCMKYPANYGQICLAFMDTLGFPNSKIFARIPFQSTEYVLSDLQKMVLKERKNEVIVSFKEYLKSTDDQMYRDYFDLLKLFNSWELFPEIIENASEENLINYTYLLEIMNENKYPELTKHKMYPSLYGKEQFYYSGGLESTEKNRAEIILLAESFYNEMNSK